MWNVINNSFFSKLNKKIPFLTSKNSSGLSQKFHQWITPRKPCKIILKHQQRPYFCICGLLVEQLILKKPDRRDGETTNNQKRQNICFLSRKDRMHYAGIQRHMSLFGYCSVRFLVTYRFQIP